MTSRAATEVAFTALLCGGVILTRAERGRQQERRQAARGHYRVSVPAAERRRGQAGAARVHTQQALEGGRQESQGGLTVDRGRVVLTRAQWPFRKVSKLDKEIAAVLQVCFFLGGFFVLLLTTRGRGYLRPGWRQECCRPRWSSSSRPCSASAPTTCARFQFACKM